MQEQEQENVQQNAAEVEQKDNYDDYFLMS